MMNGYCGKVWEDRCHDRSSCSTRYKLWTVGATMSLSLLKVVVGVLGRSETLVADGLYSFYQSFIFGKSLLVDEDRRQTSENSQSLWLVSAIAALIIAAGTIDILIFSVWRLVKAWNGMLMDPSPYTLLVASLSMLVNYLLYKFGDCIAGQPGGAQIRKLRRSFFTSIIISALAFAGAALGHWWPSADAFTAIAAAALMFKPIVKLFLGESVQPRKEKPAKTDSGFADFS